MDTIPLWQGRRIAHKDDAADLEREAAIHEFSHGMPRSEAEHRAHHEYQRAKHIEGAAHHLQGMKAALALGDRDQSRKHSTMYGLHLQALGYDPVGAVPKDIEKHIAGKDAERFYRFTPHRSDVFVVP